MHVLIVGCGYLGLRAAQNWLQTGIQVSALTRSTERAREWTGLGINAIVGDVLDSASLQALPEADACLYAVGYDRSGAADKRTVYVKGLTNVLPAIQRKIPRLIYVSSTSVYGQDGGEVVTEKSTCQPASEGGQICLDAEDVVQTNFGDLPGNSAAILRLSGLYGPQRLIARVGQLQSGTPVAGNPDAWLNLVHVDDAVQAVDQILTLPVLEPVYLLSDSQPLLRREFYGRLAELVGAPPPTFTPAGETGLGKRCESAHTLRQLNLNLRYPQALEVLPELLKLQ